MCNGSTAWGQAQKASQSDAAQRAQAARAEAEAQKKAKLRATYEAELQQALPGIDELIKSKKRDKQAQALNVLRVASRKFAATGDPHPAVQIRLAQLALSDRRPEMALEFLAFFTKSRDSLVAEHIDCWLLAAECYLHQAGFKPNYSNKAMSMEALRLFSLRIDEKKVKPVLNAKQREYVNEALVIGDWLAQQTGGFRQSQAAEVCGRALGMLGDYKQSLESYKFALQVVRGDDVSSDDGDSYRNHHKELYRQHKHCIGSP